MERRKVRDKAADKSAAFSDFAVWRHRLYRYLIHFVYPNRCPGCNAIIEYTHGAFCKKCARELIPYEKEFAVPDTDGFAAFCVYGGLAKKVLLHFKHDSCGNMDYAFACGIFEALCSRALGGEVDVITYIPMLRSDLEKRGYNQARLIARELRFLLKAPCAELLEKCRETREQKSLDGGERRSNVRGAFHVIDSEAVQGRSILLVDDLCTTGSTLSEAAKTLKEAGASKVIAAVYAKTVFEGEKGIPFSDERKERDL
ncbi:MAG: double zinc ribbon domain-containing protein [Ruminiclostridium sp.]|nr:double zinc ribbon domain-containing protein [Ruminiclostridium sp.]